jgi:hypothetical protein
MLSYLLPTEQRLDMILGETVWQRLYEIYTTNPGEGLIENYHVKDKPESIMLYF